MTAVASVGPQRRGKRQWVESVERESEGRREGDSAERRGEVR